MYWASADSSSSRWHALRIWIWSGALWLLILQDWIPLLPPPASFSSSDTDDPLLIGRNVRDVSPGATNAVTLAVALVGTLPMAFTSAPIASRFRCLPRLNRALIGCLLGTGVWSFIIWSLGAQQIIPTVLLGAVLASLVAAPAAVRYGAEFAEWRRAFILFRPNSATEREFLLSAFVGVAACWAASAVLILDWDYAVQTYPVPNVIGLVAGYTLTACIHSAIVTLIPSWAIVRKDAAA